MEVTNAPVVGSSSSTTYVRARVAGRESEQVSKRKRMEGTVLTIDSGANVRSKDET